MHYKDKTKKFEVSLSIRPTSQTSRVSKGVILTEDRKVQTSYNVFFFPKEGNGYGGGKMDHHEVRYRKLKRFI